jgi:hypothetical protein
MIAAADCDHSKLFPRMAAVVHHGGASTATASRAGVPQVVVSHLNEQYGWGRPRCRDFHRQNKRIPARCHRMTVSGLTIIKAFTTPGAHQGRAPEGVQPSHHRPPAQRSVRTIHEHTDQHPLLRSVRTNKEGLVL